MRIMGMESYEQGISGEEIAENYLKKQGFVIVKRNFHSQQGEIDIIARDKDCLVFIEVKNYSFRSYGTPVGAVRKAKKQRERLQSKTALKQGISVSENLPLQTPLTR